MQLLAAPIIALEGADGCGKSTAVHAISKYLMGERHYPYVNVVTLPNKNICYDISTMIEQFALSQPSQYQIQRFMAMNINATLQGVLAFRAANPCVPIIFDRWILSHLVYDMAEKGSAMFDIALAMYSQHRTRGIQARFNPRQFNMRDIYYTYMTGSPLIYPDIVINYSTDINLLKETCESRKPDTLDPTAANDTNLAKILKVAKLYDTVFSQLNGNNTTDDQLPKQYALYDDNANYYPIRDRVTFNARNVKLPSIKTDYITIKKDSYSNMVTSAVKAIDDLLEARCPIKPASEPTAITPVVEETEEESND